MGIADAFAGRTACTSRVCSGTTRSGCTVGTAFIGQRHKLPPCDGNDGFDGFPQQHRHCGPQPQWHFVDAVGLFDLTASPAGTVANCQERTANERRMHRVMATCSIFRGTRFCNS